MTALYLSWSQPSSAPDWNSYAREVHRVIRHSGRAKRTTEGWAAKPYAVVAERMHERGIEFPLYRDVGFLFRINGPDLNHASQLISNHPGLTMGPWESPG